MWNCLFVSTVLQWVQLCGKPESVFSLMGVYVPRWKSELNTYTNSQLDVMIEPVLSIVV